MSATAVDAMNVPIQHLADFRREALRADFKEVLARGEARPLLLPWFLLAPLILPVLYLAIPHTTRPWLYQARFLVVGVIVALNGDMMRNTSSTNMASAYAVGLIASWGTLWALTVLVWMRPQFEAERVERRLKTKASTSCVEATGSATSTALKYAATNGHSTNSGTTQKSLQRPEDAPDIDIARKLEQYEYYWQAYPANESFFTRLDWAADLCLAYRGSGWNFCIPSIPHFQRASKPLSGELVKLHTIPQTTASGFRRYPTLAAFLRTRLLSISTGYLVLDLCAVTMTRDPYFIYGPTTPPLPLPPHLSPLPPHLLALYRSALAFAGILAALHMLLSVEQVARRAAHARSPRGQLWQYPSPFGAFAPAVLDRGLAGFWGRWWHQSFRAGFVAPAAWLGRRGRRAGHGSRAGGALLAFGLSGALHGSGSLACRAETRWWLVPGFFLASGVGVVVQQSLAGLFAAGIKRLPRWVRRAGNLGFVVAWLLATQWMFIDDLGRAGLWLFEPVPVSPLRWARGEGWWRWDRGHFPTWYWGEHWWETGLGI